MSWIRTNKDQWINLNNVFHIWIEETINGFFIMGELIHDKEEIVLSVAFNSFMEAYNHVTKILKK